MAELHFILFSLFPSFAQRIPWAVRPYEPINLPLGSTLEFQFVTGQHTVYQMPSSTCDFTDSVLIGTEGGTTVLFGEPGTLYFACNIAGHCESGQIIEVTIIG